MPAEIKMDDLRGKTPDQLKDILKEAKRELFNLRFQKSAGELSNTARFSAVRKKLARVKTILHETLKNDATSIKSSDKKPANKNNSERKDKVA